MAIIAWARCGARSAAVKLVSIEHAAGGERRRLGHLRTSAHFGWLQPEGRRQSARLRCCRAQIQKAASTPAQMKTARVFARNFMTRGLRHGFGMTRGCWPSNGFGPRFGQRAFLIDDRTRALRPGHCSAREAPAFSIAARRARHQICACPPALRAKISACRARLRKNRAHLVSRNPRILASRARNRIGLGRIEDHRRKTILAPNA